MHSIEWWRSTRYYQNLWGVFAYNCIHGIEITRQSVYSNAANQLSCISWFIIRGSGLIRTQLNPAMRLNVWHRYAITCKQLVHCRVGCCAQILTHFVLSVWLDVSAKVSDCVWLQLPTNNTSLTAIYLQELFCSVYIISLFSCVHFVRSES